MNVSDWIERRQRVVGRIGLKAFERRQMAKLFLVPPYRVSGALLNRIDREIVAEVEAEDAVCAA